MDIEVVRINHLEDTCTVVLSNGHASTLGPVSFQPSKIKYSYLFPGKPRLSLRTIFDEDLIFELPTPSDHSPLHDRKVVYLDQNAWSKLSDAIHSPARIDPGERDAAMWLMKLVDDLKVVLPFSAGTLTETSHWTNADRRYKLGLTICKYSRGWQMLDPLEIRAAELRHVLSKYANQSDLELANIWTLSPNALFGSRQKPRSYAADMDQETNHLIQSISAISSVVATILDDDAVDRIDPHRWASKWNGLSKHLEDSKKSLSFKRQAVHHAILIDAENEIAEAAIDVGIAPNELDEWLSESSFSDISKLPALGMAREVTSLKVSNHQSRWQTNDLTDIFYMVQASGYADAVIGEKGFTSLAVSAQKRLGREANVFPSFTSFQSCGLLETGPLNT